MEHRRGIGGFIQRFYNTNLRYGEFRKHKGAYLASAILGYFLISSLSCGCAPVQEPPSPGGLESRVVAERAERAQEAPSYVLR